jgi:hypothetical protein
MPCVVINLNMLQGKLFDLNAWVNRPILKWSGKIHVNTHLFNAGLKQFRMVYETHKFLSQ